MKWYSILVLALLLVSCDDFIEQDISDEIVEVYTPYNGDTVLQGDIHFKWVELEGATHYNLQIVSPNFSQIDEFILDSNISNTEFYQQLNAGKYQWRIKALNNGYETAYTSNFDLLVDTSSNLSNYMVSIVAPGNNQYSNTSSVTLIWDQIAIADSYTVGLKVGANWTTGTSVESGTTTGTSYNFSTNLTEQTYTLGVQAENNYPSTTNYSTIVLNIDQTVPGQPVLNSPNYGSIFLTNDPISFDWTRANDLGTVQSPQYDSLFIYTDSLQTLYSRTELVPTNDQLNFPNTGTYFWRVKTSDEAGNQGVYSATGKFEIQ